MYTITLLLLVATSSLFLPALRRFHHNYQKAKQTRWTPHSTASSTSKTLRPVPVILSPVNTHNPFWHLFRPFVLPFFQLLPSSIARFPRIVYVGWMYDDKGGLEREFNAPIYTIVNSGQNELVINDPLAIERVLVDWKGFTKSKLYEIHNLFGENINSVNGSKWTKHKKLTSPCFNERLSARVWSEAAAQATSMLSNTFAASHKTAGSIPSSAIHTSLIQDTKIIALRVILGAGLGLRQDFSSGVRNPQPGHEMAFSEAMFLMVDNMMSTLLFAPMIRGRKWLLRLLPEKVRTVCRAVDEVGSYMDEMVKVERNKVESGSGSETERRVQGNLVSVLVKAAKEVEAEANDGVEKTTSKGTAFDVSDVKGNIYIFTIAGHETTANTMAYAIALLAAKPEWQKWVVEEIDDVLSENGVGNYMVVYPRLKRCLALMFETLRLYGPVPWLPRETTTAALAVPMSDGSELVVPPDTNLALNVYAVHTSRQIWGDDALEFRPDRFIIPAQASKPGWAQHDTDLSRGEKLVVPRSTSFLPWSAGPRVCPGMKFAQVEFVSVMCTLISQASVEPAVQEGGDIAALAAARTQLKAVIDDSGFVGPTFTIKRPEDVRLKWTKRTSHRDD